MRTKWAAYWTGENGYECRAGIYPSENIARLALGNLPNQRVAEVFYCPDEGRYVEVDPIDEEERGS